MRDTEIKKSNKKEILILFCVFIIGFIIIDLERMSTLGILHYFDVIPEKRHYILDSMKILGKEIEYRKFFLYINREFTIYHSTNCCNQYVPDGGRTWIVTSKCGVKKIINDLPCPLAGYFDGSFYGTSIFPSDASIYLFLWDPQSPNRKGIDIPIS